MTSSRRYCIHCGGEVGELLFCPNAECRGLPNFYRTVPGPESHESFFAAGVNERRQVARLRSVSPPLVEHVLLEGVNLVGACAPATLVLQSAEISSQHARIQCELSANGLWVIVAIDLGSKNGTFVNGKRVRSKALRHGDRVRLASLELEVRMLDSQKERVTLPV